MHAGDRLGKFRLDRLLGEGGMGEVWAARDMDLGRSCALKVLAPALADSHEARLRLGREARALARIKHGNVVAVYETCVIDERDIIAMELVDGEPLDKWLARERRPAAEIVATLLGVARGLAAAHEVGVIHRDVKPQNILVDAGGRAVLTDFGIAAAPDGHSQPATLAPSDDRDVAHTIRATPQVHKTVAELDLRSLAAPLTTAGVAIGTPSYMAPEQSAGEPVDERADQYAFCVALWEALAGRRPPAYDSPEGLDDSPIPRALRAPLRRGLEPDAKARFPKIAELIAALEPRPRLPRRWLAASIAGIAVAATIAAVVASRRPTPEPSLPPLRAGAPLVEPTKHVHGDDPNEPLIHTSATPDFEQELTTAELADLDADVDRYAKLDPHQAQRIQPALHGGMEVSFDTLLAELLTQRSRLAAAIVLRHAVTAGDSSSGLLARLFETLTGAHVNGWLDRGTAAQVYRSWWRLNRDRYELDPCKMDNYGLQLVSETLADLYTDNACRKASCENNELAWTDRIPDTAVCAGMVEPLLAIGDHSAAFRNGVYGLLAMLYRRHQAPELDAILANPEAPYARQVAAVIARWQAGERLDSQRLLDILVHKADRADRTVLTRVLSHAGPAVIDQIIPHFFEYSLNARGDTLEILSAYGTPAVTRLKTLLLTAPRGAAVNDLTAFFARVKGGESTDALAHYVDKLATARAAPNEWGTALADFQRAREHPVTLASTTDELVAAAKAELDAYHLRH